MDVGVAEAGQGLTGPAISAAGLTALFQLAGLVAADRDARLHSRLARSSRAAVCAATTAARAGHAAHRGRARAAASASGSARERGRRASAARAPGHSARARAGRRTTSQLLSGLLTAAA